MPTIYILLCSDGTYYTGSTSDLSRRLDEHQRGLSSAAYTFTRRPVRLAWSYEVQTLDEARLLEGQIKGWSRAKKEALIRGDLDGLHRIVADRRHQQDKKKRAKSG